MKKLENNFQKTIFVNLDDNEIVYPEQKIKKILKLLPNLNEIKSKLKEIYQDFNKDSHGYISELQKKHLKKEEKVPVLQKITNLSLVTKKLIYNQNKIEDEKCKKIFKIFKDSLEFFTLKKFPLKPIFQKDTNQVLLLFFY